MNRMLAQISVVAISILLLASVTFAAPQQMILGVGTTGDVLFTNTGGNNVNFVFTGDCGEGGNNCLSGNAYYQTNVGNYSMWMTGGPPTLGAPTGNVYPVNMNGSTINFAATAGSFFLDGTITLDQVAGGTHTPTFNGLLSISSTNLPGYAQGQKSEIDFTINLGSNGTLEQVYAGSVTTTSGYLSSGEVPPSVPEPGSILLFGSGVLGFAGLVRRKLHF